MAEGTYEYECMRAELLGVQKPSEDEFNKAQTQRLQQEAEAREDAEAAELEESEESMQNAGGKLDELNSILSSTQQKLNRFKQTACSSLSNIFNRGSVDLGDTPSTSATASRRNTTAMGGHEPNARAKDINTALDNLDEMQQQDSDDAQPRIPVEKMRSAKQDIEKKMTSQLGTLDALINKAEQAELSMGAQTKAMRKMAK